MELPRWVGETSEKPRLVEAEPGICEGLVQFCLAEAQQMAIGKASSEFFAVSGMWPSCLADVKGARGRVRERETEIEKRDIGSSDSDKHGYVQVACLLTCFYVQQWHVC